MLNAEGGGHVPPQENIDSVQAINNSAADKESEFSAKDGIKAEGKKKELTLNQMIGLGMAAMSVFTASIGYAMYGAKSEKAPLRDKEINTESIINGGGIADKAKATYIQTLVDQFATEEEITKALDAPQFKEVIGELKAKELENPDLAGCVADDKEVAELIKNYPIIGTLPYYTDIYRIDMTYEGDSEVPIIDITLITGGDSNKEAEAKMAVEKWLYSEDPGYKKLELRFTTE
ncbi:MAG: hypothetical protein WCP14_04735 [bacterium]